MKLAEWESRWATGIKDKVPVVIANLEGSPTFMTTSMRHEAPMGDFIKEYVEHLRMPWWRRDHYWDFVENKMRRTLNDGAVIRWHY